ncbi:hypothetical protein [Brachyspira murdochii]|uniref:Uncharacterized protein n=1 Tax=Brachyspira murdochii TaxID=84378 RepID=A0ABX5B290_9SPIR|nr:hypothetical protein [Brachyspira murdochii]PPS21225.1 hypothetical protein DJ52_12420 [Brachyspira murdochii]
MNINNFISSISSKIANMITISKFIKRNNDDTIQVKSSYDKTIEKKELFPYGFIAKAKEGEVIILSKGGNFDSSQILPILSSDKAPEIKEGDTCIYNEKISIIINEDMIKIGGDDFGGLIKIEELKKELEKNNQILQAILNICLGAPIPEAGNGANSAFQLALSAALAGKTIANFSNIENTKIVHGSNNK